MIWHWYHWEDPVLDIPENTIAILYDAKSNEMQMAISMAGYWYSYPATSCECGSAFHNIHERYQFWTLCPAKPK